MDGTFTLFDLNGSAQMGGAVMAKCVYCFGEICLKNTGLQRSTLFNHRMTTGTFTPPNELILKGGLYFYHMHDANV